MRLLKSASTVVVNTYDNMMWKLHMVIQKWEIPFGRIPSNYSKEILSPEMSHIILKIVFLIDIFHGATLSDSRMYCTAFLEEISQI